MGDDVRSRLQALRRLMAERGLTHYVVPSADEHLSETPPPWRRRREWLSGFTGSAGDLLVGLDPGETWLFTDSRYHLQAETELAGSWIELERVGAPGGRTLAEAVQDLADRHGPRLRLGFDPWCAPDAAAREWERRAAVGGG
ncbi:MAG: aminopeptidase P family protein, partial [Deltaproteobacteria bacterium]|nr:aminopeptidase P family protein [Deltaproteobacteria bacterium]